MSVRAARRIDRTVPSAPPRPSSDADLGELPDRLWWDPDGPARLLHAMNPIRVGFFLRELGVPAGQRVVDAGCGGGLVAAALTQAGATVIGVDPAPTSLAVARRAAGARFHAVAGRLEQLPLADASVDAVVAADVLEHVGDLPAAVREIARVLRPGGRLLFDTINRTAWSWAVALLGAERLTDLVPRGTHQWRLFIRPDELHQLLTGAGLTAVASLGLSPRLGPRDILRALTIARSGSATPAGQGTPGARGRRALQVDPPAFTLSRDRRASYVGHYRKRPA